MSLFKGNYLRVSTPITTDGRTPMTDGNNTVVYKETFLPLSAKRDLEVHNKDLPDILKKKIEVVSSTGDVGNAASKEKGTLKK